MKKRTLTGAVIAVVTVGFFALKIINSLFFDLFLFLIALVSTNELIKAFGGKFKLSKKILCYAFTSCLIPVSIFFNEYILNFVMVFLVILLVVSVFDGDGLNGLTDTLLVFAYPNVFVYCLVRINAYSMEKSFYALGLIFLVSCLCDVFAYLLGSLLKGKKLCPKISPNKTVNGAIGGVIGGILASVLFYLIYSLTVCDLFSNYDVVLTYAFNVVFGALLAVSCEVGDLFESYIKRSLNVKDMGSIMPGHGGMLDRIDGLSFVSFVVFVVLGFII